MCGVLIDFKILRNLFLSLTNILCYYNFVPNIIGFIVFLAIAVINVYPLVFSIFCSLKGNLEIFESFVSLPKEFRYENYITAWNVGNIGRYFLNTIIMAAGTIILTGVFGAMASYILSKFHFKIK